MSDQVFENRTADARCICRPVLTSRVYCAHDARPICKQAVDFTHKSWYNTNDNT